MITQIKKFEKNVKEISDTIRLINNNFKYYENLSKDEYLKIVTKTELDLLK